jgi:hypothetical protein
MSAGSAYARRPGVVYEVLRRLEDWLLEPLPETEAEPAPAGIRAEVPRVVVAVAGIAPGCGASTVARALAARLALADPDGAALVLAAADEPLPLAIATRPAAALRSRLRAPGVGASAGGRVCTLRSAEPLALVPLARSHAPAIIDVREARAAAAIADLVVVVAPGDSEPALARAFADSLEGRPAMILANRPREPERWSGRAAALLPDSRLGARIAAAGWPPGGSLGRAIAHIADACGAIACA